jgi:ribosomal protein L40E
VDLGPQPASANPTISVQYEKADRALSAPEPAPTPVPAPAAASAPAAPKAESIPGWAIGAGGAILGFLGAFLLYSRGGAKPSAAKSSEPKKATYCPECGTKGRRTDAFCMECGARLPRS